MRWPVGTTANFAWVDLTIDWQSCQGDFDSDFDSRFPQVISTRRMLDYAASSQRATSEINETDRSEYQYQST